MTGLFHAKSSGQALRGRGAGAALSAVPDSYKWTALFISTLGMLMATIDASIVLISLPDIFDGIRLNPLTAGNTSYFLWMLMGYMLVTAVLVVPLTSSAKLNGLLTRTSEPLPA